MVAAPVHRAILAVDIENSTTRGTSMNTPTRMGQRNQIYKMLGEALRDAGISHAHLDQTADRGDGLVVLVRPDDGAPVTRLLTPLVTTLREQLARYNARLDPRDRATHPLRVRMVVHAGQVHTDDHGLFGEAMDMALRTLDSPALKLALRQTNAPVCLAVSEDIYWSVIRHHHDGLDPESFQPLIRLNINGRRRQGYVQIPPQQPADTPPSPAPTARALPADSLLGQLSTLESDQLRSSAARRSYTPDSAVSFEGGDSDHVVILEAGWAKAYRTTPDGREVLVRIYGPGDIIGEDTVLGHQARGETVIALSDVQALIVAGPPFRQFLDTNRSVERALTSILVRRLHGADERLAALADVGAEGSLAAVLLPLFERHGRFSADGSVHLPFGLTQEELAGLAGLSRMSVTRVMQLWRRKGAVHTNRRSLVLLDPAALRQRAHLQTSVGLEGSEDI